MNRSRSLSLGGCLAAAMLLLAGLLPAAQPDAAPAVERRLLQANDVDGKPVTVPQADRASVLVFLMAEQPQSQKALELLAGVVGPTPAVQVVAVASGPQAQALAKSLKGKLPGTVVADPEYAIAGRLSVRAWPTTLVVLPGGEELAHLAGLAKSYAKDLEAYLEFAGGKIDRATLNSRLATGQVVEDDPHQMARRHLEVAERQMAKGLFQEARQELERGLGLAPADLDLQLANARVLLALGLADQALASLDKMDAAANQPWKVDTVRGRALVALKRWDQAAEVLKRAIALNPDPAEAYYALGLLHQHKGEWEPAAKAYRAAFESTVPGRTIKAPEPPSGGPPVAQTPAK